MHSHRDGGNECKGIQMTKQLTPVNLIIVISIFLALFTNLTFFKNTIEIYPFDLKNILFLLSLVILLICIHVFLFSLICYQRTIKPFLILIVLSAANAAYFMDSYKVIIDHAMIDNIINTDIKEIIDLLSIKQLLYFVILGLFPAFLIYKTPLINLNFKQALFSRIKLMSLALIIALVLILIFSRFYASFFREHRSLRLYSNPTYYLYSTGKYINHFFKGVDKPFEKIALDAKITPSNNKPKLIIFVVGETARADHFALNGYTRNTNPYLAKEKVLSFNHVWSCGTSTAYSVPCLFSIYNRDNYSKAKAKSTENILDILQRVGVNVLWLDNNSDSKGVATRISYKNYRTAKNNPNCHNECRDMGMLKNLQPYIKQHSNSDIFIILHQMGNHGPAYYKRYPAEFERFTPVCKTNQLEQCDQQSIINAYDNALLYTDYFLSQTITLLKKNNNQYQTALFYVSDHGESLGENNFYLHGLPYLFAPDVQKRVPLIMWFGENFNKKALNLEKLNQPFSHDYIFHTILALMEIKTQVYNQELDIFAINK